jgi:hypothetical protein
MGPAGHHSHPAGWKGLAGTADNGLGADDIDDYDEDDGPYRQQHYRQYHTQFMQHLPQNEQHSRQQQQQQQQQARRRQPPHHLFMPGQPMGLMLTGDDSAVGVQTGALDAVAAVAAAELHASSSSGSHAEASDAAAAAGTSATAAAAAAAMVLAADGGNSKELVAFNRLDSLHAAALLAQPTAAQAAAATAVQEAVADAAAGHHAMLQLSARYPEVDSSAGRQAASKAQQRRLMQQQLEELGVQAGLEPSAAAAAAAAATAAAAAAEEHEQVVAAAAMADHGDGEHDDDTGKVRRADRNSLRWGSSFGNGAAENMACSDARDEDCGNSDNEDRATAAAFGVGRHAGGQQPLGRLQAMAAAAGAGSVGWKDGCGLQTATGCHGGSSKQAAATKDAVALYKAAAMGLDLSYEGAAAGLGFAKKEDETGDGGRDQAAPVVASRSGGAVQSLQPGLLCSGGSEPLPAGFKGHEPLPAGFRGVIIGSAGAPGQAAALSALAKLQSGMQAQQEQLETQGSGSLSLRAVAGGQLSQWGSLPVQSNDVSSKRQRQRQHHLKQQQQQADVLNVEDAGSDHCEEEWAADALTQLGQSQQHVSEYAMLVGSKRPVIGGGRAARTSSNGMSQQQQEQRQQQVAWQPPFSSSDGITMPSGSSQQLAAAASGIATILENAVANTVAEALPHILAGFAQCVGTAVAEAARGASSCSSMPVDAAAGQEEQLLTVAVDRLLEALRSGCERAIATRAVAGLLSGQGTVAAGQSSKPRNSSSSALAAVAGASGPLSPAVAALQAAAAAAGAMPASNVATAAAEAAAGGLVHEEHVAAAAEAAGSAVRVARLEQLAEAAEAPGTAACIARADGGLQPSAEVQDMEVDTDGAAIACIADSGQRKQQLQQTQGAVPASTHLAALEAAVDPAAAAAMAAMAAAAARSHLLDAPAA